MQTLLKLTAYAACPLSDPALIAAEVRGGTLAA
jgi:hypothetical protein